MVPELEVYQKITKLHMQTCELYSGLMFSGTDSRHLNTFFLLALFLFFGEMQKPRVTEIQVRMDCNGCVQKIKKALLGISGVYELYIDFPQQKITIIGCADPEKIVKAIKKTRKTAIICSHTEPPDPQAQPSDPDNQGEAPPQESANPPQQESATPPPSEGPPTEEASPAEAPKDPPPPAESPKPDAAEAPASKPVQSSGPKDVEEVHVIYHHPPDFGYRYGYNPSMSSPNMGQGYISGYWHSYPTGPVFRPEPPAPALAPAPAPAPAPTYVTHSYNTHRASPYVTGYEYIRPPPQYTHSTRPESYQQPQYSVHYSRPAESYPLPPQYTHYSRPERYREDYHYGNNGNGNITSVFSDENPNACRIA
nr:extensin-1-like isoform X1 [Coffea arabica]